MGFTINTNVGSLNAQAQAGQTSRALGSSLEKLSSGLRINKAADDSSGLVIADSLRAQANGLGAAIRNANDAVGVIQIADKAIDEQLKILDTIKAKSVQASQDTQNRNSRGAIQADISRLIEQLDNIAGQTSYNGIKLLSGSFTNKEFQVGASSNETISATIGATSSDKIGTIRKETSATVTASGTSTLTFTNPAGGADITLESVKISSSANTGLGVLAEVINKNSDALGVRAVANVQTTGSSSVTAGNISGLNINGTTIGNVDNIKANDNSGVLVNAINKFTSQTGVIASTDTEGRLNLTSTDGRGISVSTSGGGEAVTNVANVSGAGGSENYGRLTLTQLGSNDIRFSSSDADGGSLNASINSAGASASFNLREVTGKFTANQAAAAGGFANGVLSAAAGDDIGAGVTSKVGANIVNDIAQQAIELLDSIRADIGSVQNQLEVTINNISTTQVNVKAAESGIRDVDFASESANFQKNNILAQSGTYALSQANAVQQNVLRLLQ
jgi:flagellin